MFKLFVFISIRLLALKFEPVIVVSFGVSILMLFAIKFDGLEITSFEFDFDLWPFTLAATPTLKPNVYQLDAAFAAAAT